MHRIRTLLRCLLACFFTGCTVEANRFYSKGQPLVKDFSAADPDAHVWNGTVYLFLSKDANLKDFGLGPDDWTYEHMDGYHLISSTDMVNWEDHGEIFHSRNVAWGPQGWMWAPSAAWNGQRGSASKYFLYFPHKDWEGQWRIGVATAPSPTGPFTDSGKPMDLVGIDPKVFIDTDRKAYMYFNGAQVVRLNDNLMELAEQPRSIDYGANSLEPKFRFEEGSFMHKRGNTYFYSYSNWEAQETTAYYATGTSPYGPFTWQGALAGKKSGAQDHHSIIQFKGVWYYFDHMDTPWDEKYALGWYGQRRISCYRKMYYTSTSTIQFVTPSSMLINTGGTLLTTKGGASYQWDIWYSSGNSAITTSWAPIAGTENDELYQSYRYGQSFSYGIPLANGKYRVVFMFAETHHDAAGRRKFHVSLEGNRVIDNLDVYAMVGKNKAHDVFREVTVADRELSISFDATVDTGMISAMRIVPVSMFRSGW